MFSEKVKSVLNTTIFTEYSHSHVVCIAEILLDFGEELLASARRTAKYPETPELFLVFVAP